MLLIEWVEFTANIFTIIGIYIAYLEYRKNKREEKSKNKIKMAEDVISQFKKRGGVAYVNIPEHDIIYTVYLLYDNIVKFNCVSGIPETIKFNPTKNGKDIKEMPKLEKIAKEHFNSYIEIVEKMLSN